MPEDVAVARAHLHYRHGVERAQGDEQDFAVRSECQVIRSGAEYFHLLHLGQPDIEVPDDPAIIRRRWIVVDHGHEIAVFDRNIHRVSGRARNQASGMAAGSRGEFLLPADLNQRSFPCGQVHGRNRGAIVQADVQGSPPGAKGRGKRIFRGNGRMLGIQVQVENAFESAGLRAEFHGNVAQSQGGVDQVLTGILRIRHHGNARRGWRRIIQFDALGKRDQRGSDLDHAVRRETPVTHPVDSNPILGAVPQFGILFGRGDRHIKPGTAGTECDPVIDCRYVGRPIEIQPRPGLRSVRQLPVRAIVDCDRLAEARRGVAKSVIQECDISPVWAHSRVDRERIEIRKERARGRLIQYLAGWKENRLPGPALGK